MSSSQSSFSSDHASLGNRLTSFALSLAICVLIGLMLLGMGAFSPPANERGANLVAVDMSPQSASNTPHLKAVARTATAHAVTRPPVPEQQPTPQPTTEPVPPLNLIHLSRDELAAADIGKMARPAPAGGSQGAPGGSSSTAYGPGEGPGGAHLYNAEWVREPTHAELAGYMNAAVSRQGDWAVIACKTIERYHVENCQEMDEYPRGSGLARALRQAAWQFLVRPPRIEGRTMVGTWVRIRFDFTRGAARDDTGTAP